MGSDFIGFDNPIGHFLMLINGVVRIDMVMILCMPAIGWAIILESHGCAMLLAFSSGLNSYVF